MGLSDQVSDTILQLVDQYGIFAIFVALVLDSAMILPFVPGEVLLVIATNELATGPGTLLFVIIVCTAGTVLGSFLLFLVAKYGGRKFIMSHPRLFMMNPARRDKLEKTFQRPVGQSLVLFFRLFPFLRIIVSLPAGLARMSNISFLILTSIGSFLFNGAVMFVVYESKQKDSKVVAFVDHIRINYGEPAIEWAGENLPIVVAVVLVLGILSTIRRSVRMVRHDDVPTRNTLLGTLAVTTLFWGGVMLIIGLWTDPVIVYDLIGKTGVDIVAATDQYFLGPLVASAGIGLLFCLLGLSLVWFRQQFVTAAERKRRVAKAMDSMPVNPEYRAPTSDEP